MSEDIERQLSQRSQWRERRETYGSQDMIIFRDMDRQGLDVEAEIQAKSGDY